jgi:hypothetical protein
MLGRSKGAAEAAPFCCSVPARIPSLDHLRVGDLLGLEALAQRGRDVHREPARARRRSSSTMALRSRTQDTARQRPGTAAQRDRRRAGGRALRPRHQPLWRRSSRGWLMSSSTSSIGCAHRLIAERASRPSRSGALSTRPAHSQLRAGHSVPGSEPPPLAADNAERLPSGSCAESLDLRRTVVRNQASPPRSPHSQPRT